MTGEQERRKGWSNGCVFVAPFLFFYAVFLISPAIQVCYFSLTNSDIAGKGSFVGLEEFCRINS